jgi:hypothetical protein
VLEKLRICSKIKSINPRAGTSPAPHENIVLQGFVGCDPCGRPSHEIRMLLKAKSVYSRSCTFNIFVLHFSSTFVHTVFGSSSAVERSTVNRMVVGSIPTFRAKQKPRDKRGFYISQDLGFFHFWVVVRYSCAIQRFSYPLTQFLLSLL